MVIRKAVPKDLLQSVKILEEVKKHMLYKGIDQWDQTYPNKIVLTQDISKEEAFICEEEGEILAYMVLNELCDEEYNDLNWKTFEPYLIIHRLFVKPAAQGKGISGKMIVHAEQYASDNQYRSVRLDAYSLNDTANRVYLKKGYDFVGTVNFRKGVFNCYEEVI